jgi:hypothetical protein
MAMAILSGISVGFSISAVGQQGSAIRVRVVDDNGSALPAAEVRVVGHPALVALPAPNGTFTFKDVAPGTYQVSVTNRGYKDPAASSVVVFPGKTTDLSVELEPGPPKASDFRIHETLLNSHLYSEPLKNIGQQQVCQEPIPEQTEWYRFMWVPTFQHPVFFRVDLDADGAATLLTVVWSGQGGYEWGKPVKTSRKLTWEEEGDLFGALSDIGFWTLPSEVERPPNVIVLDGTEWLIEGLKDGNCHVVTRYSSPLTEVFERAFLTGIARIKP